MQGEYIINLLDLRLARVVGNQCPFDFDLGFIRDVCAVKTVEWVEGKMDGKGGWVWDGRGCGELSSGRTPFLSESCRQR